MNQQNTINRVKSGLQGFEMAFNSLPRNQIKAVRQEIMKELGWSVSLFYYKKRGETAIWIHEVPHIETIFCRFNINPYTGQPISK
jgi:hypothetical protein